MKLTLQSTFWKDKNKKSIEVDYDDVDIYDFRDELLVPLLLSYGFAMDTIERIIKLNEEE